MLADEVGYVVGVDTHADTHALALVEATTQRTRARSLDHAAVEALLAEGRRLDADEAVKLAHGSLTAAEETPQPTG